MGREIKMVSVDFDWPLETVWQGFLNPLTEQEPPTGPAYQIWETVSEGSPISPPFVDPRELAAWMVANDQSVTKGTTQEEWVKFITAIQWSPSLVDVGGQTIDGVRAVVADDKSIHSEPIT